MYRHVFSAQKIWAKCESLTTVQSSAELTLNSQKESCNGIPGEVKGGVQWKGHCLIMYLMLSFKGKHLQVYILSVMFLSLDKNNFSLLLS